jgi:5,10-methylenetetrahydromethanopterin reductase
MFHGMYEADPSLLDAVEGGPEWRAAVEAFPERERHLHTHEQHFVAMTERDRASVTGDLIAATTWTATADAVRARAKETADSGVSELMYVPMGSDVIRELRAVRAAID